MSVWARIHAAKHREVQMNEAERTQAALRPYMRHGRDCAVDYDWDDPRDERCTCGLRQVWRIRETAE